MIYCVYFNTWLFYLAFLDPFLRKKLVQKVDLQYNEFKAKKNEKLFCYVENINFLCGVLNALKSKENKFFFIICVYPSESSDGFFLLEF